MHNKINWDGRTFGFDLLMINDQARNRFYERALLNAKDKVVLDIGAGTGLLSVMAAAAGAKKVYSFERDTSNFQAAQYFIDQSGFGDRITLVCADILEVDYRTFLHDSIDLIITETFANDCFIENFPFLVEHVEKHFNLAPTHEWVPDNITLEMGLVDITRTKEFRPGVVLPQPYTHSIECGIQHYRDTLYQSTNVFNMPVAQIPKITLTTKTIVDRYQVKQGLKDYIESISYTMPFDHDNLSNPYIKIDWQLHYKEDTLHLNGCDSWRSIAFKIDGTKSKQFYFRYNPLTSALVGSQI